MPMTKTDGKTAKTLMLILADASDCIRVRWALENVTPEEQEALQGMGDYRIPLSKLAESSDAVREKLEDLEDCDWSETEEARDGRNLRLRNLARAGIDLYETLMQGDPEHRVSLKTAKAFRRWFEETVLPVPDDWRIQVVHQEYDAPVIPWGFVYAPTGESLPAEGGQNGEAYDGFWALRFRLACRGINRMDADRKYNKRDPVEAKLALTLNIDEDDVNAYGKGNIGDKEDVRERLSRDVATFEKFPRAYSEYDIFWYIFLNKGESGGYRLADREIDDALIERLTDMIGNLMIMFLDGNAVIRGERGVKWVHAMLQLGRTGLIASETDIKNEQLDGFGWSMWKSILESERPLIEAIDAARREFWPKSLLYGIYCDPLNIYFAPPPEQEIGKADRFMDHVRSIGAKTGG